MEYIINFTWDDEAHVLKQSGISFRFRLMVISAEAPQ